MHPRKFILVMLLISLIHAHYAIRVDTDVTSAVNDERSESGVADQPKAEALTLVIKKHVPLRPVKVIERKDDVVVIHTNKRSKRKQNTRRRRPSNQYRSKIKHSSAGSSSFGGFKDFSTNDLRFPPFSPSSQSSSSPGRASNKYKFGPPKTKSSSPPVTSYEYNAPPPRRPPPSRYSSSPPASSFNHIESHYAPQPVTLQQQQQKQSNNNNFPSSSFSGFNSGEPPREHQQQTFFNADFSKFSTQQPQNTFFNSEVSQFPTISNFPLGDGSSFEIPKTSYGEPVRSASNVDTTSYQFNSNVVSALNNLNKVNSNKVSGGGSNNFPKLPSKYETSDFSTPTRHNPLHSNSFTSDFATFDLGEKTTSTTRFPNRFNKFHNYDYDFRNHKTPLLSNTDEDEDEEDDEDLDYFFSTTTRPRPRPTIATTTTEFTPTTRKFKKGVYGKRKRPVKIAQEQHNLDTDDLRDAFSDATNDDFHEVALNSDDFLNFDSQRNVKKTQQLHELRSNLKLAKRNPAFRSALGDDFQILSVQKSLEKDPSNVNLFQRRRDDERYREFKVGGDLRFSEAAPVMWNGDMNNKPHNHRF